MDALIALGAVPFITTSMARAGMSHDSSNPIFGEQHNPRYKGFTAGGSSGGEGIALSVDASPLGVGTDIGGSVRFPPSFNGVCGLNPTRRRVSQKGVFLPGNLPRFDLIVTIGPMARYVDDLAMFFRAIFSETAFNLDPALVPLPFKESEFQNERPLKIGYFASFESNDMARAVPSVQRAILEGVSILKKQGHEVTEFKPPRPYYGFSLVLRTLLHDSGLGLSELLAYEPIPAKKKVTMLLLNVPKFIRKRLVNAFYAKFGLPAVPLRDAVKGVSSGINAALLCREIEKYRQEFVQASSQFDVVLCPVFPVPIPKKDEDDTFNNVSAIYAILWNLLDLPAGVVCTSRVTSADNELAQKRAFELVSEGDKFNAHLHQVQNETDLPLSVQVVGRPFQEENVLRVMKSLESSVRFDRHDVQVRKDHHL